MAPRALLHQGAVYVLATGKNYYFAYGSNMNEKQMKKRCPSSKLVGKAELPGYSLAFTGYSNGWKGAVATLIKSGGSVPGLLYTVTNDDIKALDKFEGHPTIYKRKVITVGDKEASVYIRRLKKHDLVSAKYLIMLLKAYRKNGFDINLLIDAAEQGL